VRYSGRPVTKGEAELERLLEQVDEAIGAEGGVDTVYTYWEAWEALPGYVRDLFLITAPDWWALPAGVFRRLLLTAAYLIVWDGVRPLVALRRAARRLGLPPPRRTSSPPGGGTRPMPPTPYAPQVTTVRPYRVRTAARGPHRLQIPPVRRYAIPPRRWGRPPIRRLGRIRQLGFRR
jgi:hypothetical protein